MLRASVGELAPLHVDRNAWEEPVAAAVVEVEVRVDDHRDAAHQLVRQAMRRRLPVVELGPRVDHSGVDEDEPACRRRRGVRPGGAACASDAPSQWMVDRVHETRPGHAVHHDLATQVDPDIVTAQHDASIWLRRPKRSKSARRTTARSSAACRSPAPTMRGTPSMRQRTHSSHRCRRTSARRSSTASPVSCASGTRTWPGRSARKPGSRSARHASRPRGPSRRTRSRPSRPGSSPATSSRWERPRPARARSRSPCVVPSA